MTTENDKWMQGAGRPEQTQGESRARGGGAESGQNGCEQVSISKEDRGDGVSATTLTRRYLRKSGELKVALESGALDLDNFVLGCVEGMNAMKAIPCNGQIVYEPDWPTRLAFRKFVTETVEGMPIKRQEIITKKLTTEDDLIKQASESPAFCKSLMKTLQKINEQHLSNKGGVKNVTPDSDES